MVTSIVESQTRGAIRRFRALAQQLTQVNWALADQAIVSGTNFATTVILARFLGVEEFGRFALAWLAVFFAQNLQIALIVQPMMNIGAKQKKSERAAYTGTVVLQQIVLALASTVLVFGFLTGSSLYVPQLNLAELAVPVSLLVLFFQASEFLRRYYFVFAQPRWSLVVDGVRYSGQLAMLLGGFLLMRDQMTTGVAFYIMAVASLIGAIAGAMAFERMRFDRDVFRKVTARQWRFSRWLAPTVFSLWARENLLYTVIGTTVGLAEVGIVRAAQQLVTMVNVPIHGFANVVHVRAAAAYASRGYAGLIDFIDAFVLRYKAGIACFLALIAVFGGSLLTIIFGPDYAGHGTLVAAFAFVMALYLVRNMVSIMVQAMEATAYDFYAAAAGIVLMGVSIIPLVDAFGIAGAIMSYALYECAALAAISFGIRNRGDGT